MKTELEVFSGAFEELGIDGFDFGAVLEADTFFSIDTLINTISIFEAQGVDISETDFIQEWILSFMFSGEPIYGCDFDFTPTSDLFFIHLKTLDDAISVDFWGSTVASFSVSVFTDVVAGFDSNLQFDLSDILVELEKTGLQLCFGPGSNFVEGTGCTCGTDSAYDFMVFNSDLSECLCKNGIEEGGVSFELSWNEKANSCQCSDRFLKREADGSCVPKSLVEVQVKNDLNQPRRYGWDSTTRYSL